MDDAELIQVLRDARQHELAAFCDLQGAQLLGRRAHHLEPPIWEMGHVAWFQEYWLLRHLDGRAPLHARFDGIYDAFHVSYKLRWSHGFPSKDATLEPGTTALVRHHLPAVAY